MKMRYGWTMQSTMAYICRALWLKTEVHCFFMLTPSAPGIEWKFEVKFLKLHIANFSIDLL